MLAQLATGIDVNVRFNAPDAFEATREVAVFDLLGIPLVHGWVFLECVIYLIVEFGIRMFNS